MKLNTAVIVDKDTGVYCQNQKQWKALCEEFGGMWDIHEYQKANVYYPLDGGCKSSRNYADSRGYLVYEFTDLVQPRKKKVKEIEIFNLL